jgi:hypothetical protein
MPIDEVPKEETEATDELQEAKGEINDEAERGAAERSAEELKFQDGLPQEIAEEVKAKIDKTWNRTMETILTRVKSAKMSQADAAKAIGEYTDAINGSKKNFDIIKNEKSSPAEKQKALDEVNAVNKTLGEKYGNMQKTLKTVRKAGQRNIIKRIGNYFREKVGTNGLSDKMAKASDDIETINDSIEKEGSLSKENSDKLQEAINKNFSELCNPNDSEVTEAASQVEGGWETWKKLMLGMVIIGGLGGLVWYGLHYSSKMSGCQQLIMGGTQSVLSCGDFYENNEAQCTCGSLRTPLNKNRNPTDSECSGDELAKPYCNSASCGTKQFLCTEQTSSRKDGAVLYFYQYHSPWEGIGAGLGDLVNGFDKTSGLGDLFGSIGKYLVIAFYVIIAIVVVYFLVSLFRGYQSSAIKSSVAE